MGVGVVRRAVALLRGRLARELASFGVVGTLAFFVDLVVFNALRLVVDPLLARVGAGVVSMTVSYVGSRYLTFRHRSSGHSTAAEFGLFTLANVLGLVVALATLLVSREVLGFTGVVADNISSIIGTAVLGTMVRWWAYRKLVFRHSTDVVDTSGEREVQATR